MSEKLIHREVTFSPRIERRLVPIRVNSVNLVVFKREKKQEREENLRNKRIQARKDAIGHMSVTKNRAETIRNRAGVIAAGLGGGAAVFEMHDYQSQAIITGTIAALAGMYSVLGEGIRRHAKKTEISLEESIDRLQNG